MSGTAGVANSFANAVTATGAQLDANYTTIVAYLNDPTNRNNYTGDSGSTNTVVLTFSPPVVGGYTAGLEITFKANATNTGATVINSNGLGNANFINADGSALSAGQLQAGGLYKAAHNGSAFVFIGGAAVANQAAMETATAVGSFVTPNAVKWHPGVGKVWCVFDGTAVGTTSVSVGYGVTTVIRASTGNYQITFATPFSSANYAAFGAPGTATGAPGIQVSGRGTATCTLVAFATAAAVPMDVTFVHFIAFGDLP